MDEVGDSDILVHWLELNLSRRLIGKIYGVSPMPETYVEWKALAERLNAQQHCFDGVITQQNSMHTIPLLPTACPCNQTILPLPHAPLWPSHWPAPLPLPPCHVPPMLVMPWWWIMPMPLEWCAPVSDVARLATWSESAPSRTRAHRS